MFEFKILPDGGESFTVKAGMRDVYVWEKTHRGSKFGQLTERQNMSASALFELAFVAARRSGKLPAGLTETQFATDYDIELVDDSEDGEEETVPDFSPSAPWPDPS